MSEISLLVPLMVAMGSALHCLGMCGGIAGALTLSLPISTRQHRLHTLSYLLAVNVGRLTSYALAGWLMARFGQPLFMMLSPQYGHRILEGIAGLTLILTGFYFSGQATWLRGIERLGMPLWRALEPYGRRFITPHHIGHALLFGVVWGWLPCSLVYTALIWSSAIGTPIDSALHMALFGLGTCVVTLPASWTAHRLAQLTLRYHIKVIVAFLSVAAGLATLFYALFPVEHYLPTQPFPGVIHHHGQ
ncbi:MAG: sulfite exporter TauE/SafE family protein [Magnetococcales bacterium]|nr:sulfite exporter TauE/SafE family protein [Magnetococcales bacterium]